MKHVRITIEGDVPDETTEEEIANMALAAYVQVEEPEQFDEGRPRFATNNPHFDLEVTENLVEETGPSNAYDTTSPSAMPVSWSTRPDRTSPERNDKNA